MNEPSPSNQGTDAFGLPPLHERSRLLPIYHRMAADRCCAGVDGEIEIAVGKKEYLRLLYEMGSTGISSTNGTLMWKPWPGGPVALPHLIEIRVPGGKIIFRQNGNE